MGPAEQLMKSGKIQRTHVHTHTHMCTHICLYCLSTSSLHEATCLARGCLVTNLPALLYRPGEWTSRRVDKHQSGPNLAKKECLSVLKVELKQIPQILEYSLRILCYVTRIVKLVVKFSLRSHDQKPDIMKWHHKFCLIGVI